MARTALLVPCYNAARFMPRLAAQVRALDPTFDEVLLYDDASTDATIDLARDLGFTIIKGAKNLGPGGARNALAVATDAEWIHFHDVDDEIHPQYLAKVVADDLSEFDVVFHFVDFVDEATRVREIVFDYDPKLFEADVQRQLLHRPMGSTSSFMRRAKFLEIGGFDSTMRCFEDGDMHFRLVLARARVYLLPEILEVSLRHARGASADQGYCWTCRAAFLERYRRAVPPRLLHGVGVEAERAARELIGLRRYDTAAKAIGLAKACGIAVPTTRNPLLRLARALVPPILLLRVQHAWRRRSATSAAR